MKDKTKKLLQTLFVLLIYFIFILKFSSTKLTITNFLSYLIFLTIILIIYYKDLKKYYLDLKKDKNKVVTILLYFVVFFLLSAIFSNIILNIIEKSTSIKFNVDTSNKTIFSLFKIFPKGTLFVIFFTCIFTPLVEELVFRKSIRDVIKNNVIFVIVSSLLSWYFQVSLLNPSIPEFVLAISTLLNSLFASIIFVRKDNILYSIFPRMLYNIVICLIQFLPM